MANNSFNLDRLHRSIDKDFFDSSYYFSSVRNKNNKICGHTMNDSKYDLLINKSYYTNMSLIDPELILEI
jgi:hypothetical protein